MVILLCLETDIEKNLNILGLEEGGVAAPSVLELFPRFLSCSQGFGVAPRILQFSQGFGVAPRILECSQGFGVLPRF